MKKKKLDIIYEDKNILVVNKKSGMLTIATSKESIKTLYHEAREYIKKQNPHNKIFIVHRLDKHTSGVVLFSKSESLKKYLQDNWNAITNREYIAIVEGTLKNKKGVLKTYLKEDKFLKTYSSKDGRLAITDYQVLDKNNSYSLLKLQIKTGRKNQIRVSLSDIKNPIVGDKKYGANKNPLGRLGLHALSLKINIKGKEYDFKAKIPDEFKLMFKSLENYEKEVK